MEGAERLEISEGQLMVFLPYLQTSSVGYEYQATENGSRSGKVGGIVHWRKALQHPLRTYAAEQAITEALDDFEDVFQTENESETSFVARFNNKVYRYGNVHAEDDKIDLYIKGLLPMLMTIVQFFRNETQHSEPRMERIGQFSREVGE